MSDFERSILYVRKIRFMDRGFQMKDLTSKIGRVTGVDHKHNKLVLHRLLR